MKKKLILLGLMLSALLAACGDSTSTSAPTQSATTAPATKAATLAGQTQRMGAGTVKSWVKVDETGKPASLGLTFDETALQNLPIEGGSTVLTLPKEVVNQVPVVVEVVVPVEFLVEGVNPPAAFRLRRVVAAEQP